MAIAETNPISLFYLIFRPSAYTTVALVPTVVTIQELASALSPNPTPCMARTLAVRRGRVITMSPPVTLSSASIRQQMLEDQDLETRCSR